MNCLLFTLIALISFIFSEDIQKEDKLIMLTIYIETKKLGIKIIIGNKDKYEQLIRPINQEADFSCLTTNYISLSDSSQYQIIQQQNEGITYSNTWSLLYRDKVYHDLLYFHPFNNTCSNHTKSGWYSFAYTFSDTSNSIVHLLKSIGEIDRLAYSVILDTQIGRYRLYLGGIPLNATEIKHKAKCKVIPNQPAWACRLTQVTVGDLIYSRHMKSGFQAMRDFIYVPRDFMDELISKGLRQQLKDRICLIQITNEMERFLYCKAEGIGLLPSFTFTFEDITMSLTGRDLADRFGKYLEFYIRDNPSSKDTWIFGSAFLRIFDSLFDYEDGSITFYSSERNKVQQLERKNLRSDALSGILLPCLLVVGLIGISLVAYQKFQLEKHLQMKTSSCLLLM